ncbi:MAG TPA: 5'-nucleotidase C-terminal domain-containing protein, partial [Gemmatimonadales bacterium]
MNLLCALLVALQTPASPTPDTAHIVIVATTDVHGRVLGWDDVRDAEAPGGLSRAATIIGTLRAQYPDQVVLVDAGDLIQGNPFATYFAREDKRRPNPVVDAMNALQADVATPGNHEFNFGLETLRSVAADATYRYVSANIWVSVTAPERSDSLMFAPHVVVTRGGVRIGVTGFTTPGVMVWDRANVVGRVRVQPIARAAPAALRSLDQDSVDFKLVLVHAGLGGPSSYDTTGVGPENDAAALAYVSPKPDLVVFGHTHREVRDTVINGVHFVQPRNWAQSLAVVHVWFRRVNGRWAVDHLRADAIPLATVSETQPFVKRFEPAHNLVRTWAATPLGNADAGFDARYGRTEDTPLIDFINAVERTRAGADLASTADFDVGAGLPAGEVHLRDVAGIYPYENTLRAIRISGRQLLAYLEYAARYYRTYAPGRAIIDPAVPGYDFDIVSGVNYAIDLSQPVGSRIRGLTFRGRPVAPGDSFTLALDSYRAAGGGGYAMLQGAPVVYDRGEDIRDLLADAIRTAGTLHASAYARPEWRILPPAQAVAHAAFAPPPAEISQADSTMLRVIAITDLHGALAPRIYDWSHGRPVGGVAALKGWLDSLSSDCGCTSVRLDGGDEMQGTPISNFAYGRPVIAALNQLGLDAAAIGNHEFDWSVDTLRARIAESHYQWVSANITDSIGSARPAWAEPFTVISRGGLKIAVIGLTTASTPTTTAPRNVTGLAFGDPAAAVRRSLPAARAAAHFVIVLAHEGALCDSGACRGPIVDLARALDSGSVDLIVAGHTHARVNTRVHGIPIVEAGSSGRDVAYADFVRVAGKCCEVRASVVDAYADSVKSDQSLATLVLHAQAKVDSVTSRPIATLRYAMARTGAEYPLGRLIADAQRNMAKADVAIMNNGGIRADLPQGT